MPTFWWPGMPLKKKKDFRAGDTRAPGCVMWRTIWAHKCGTWGQFRLLHLLLVSDWEKSLPNHGGQEGNARLQVDWHAKLLKTIWRKRFRVFWKQNTVINGEKKGVFLTGASIRTCFQWPTILRHNSKGYCFSISFLDVPSEPKRDFTILVATGIDWLRCFDKKVCVFLKKQVFFSSTLW